MIKYLGLCPNTPLIPPFYVHEDYVLCYKCLGSLSHNASRSLPTLLLGQNRSHDRRDLLLEHLLLARLQEVRSFVLGLNVNIDSIPGQCIVVEMVSEECSR